METITITSSKSGRLPFFAEGKGADTPFHMINKSIRINAPIEEVWQVVGKEFEHAHRWASSLSHSEALDDRSVNGSSCSTRGCDVKGFGNIEEVLAHYSDERHELSYIVVKGMPKMVKYAANSWRLKQLSNGSTEVQMQLKMETSGLIGKIMKSVMMKNFSKLLDEITVELKYYVEHGEPHPRKVKALGQKN